MPEERQYIHPFMRLVEPRHRQPGFTPEKSVIDQLRKRRRFSTSVLVDAAGKIDDGYKWDKKTKQWVPTDEKVDWKNWYSSNDEILSSIFGKDRDLFKSLLAVTSPRVSVKKNVNEALRVYKALLKNEPIPEDLFHVHKTLLDKLFKGEGIAAPKVGPFERNLFGDREAVTIDTHMLQLLSGSFDKETKEWVAPENINNTYYYFADSLVRRISKQLGWTPDQTQAALWIFNIELRGENPASYSGILSQLKDQPWVYQLHGEILEEQPLGEQIPQLQEEVGGPFLSDYEEIDWPTEEEDKEDDDTIEMQPLEKTAGMTKDNVEVDLEETLHEVFSARAQAILDASRFWEVALSAIDWYKANT